MKLTHDNYHSQAANMAYMSVSQYKAFMACEKAALAELHGETTREESTALLIGSYVDAYFSGELAAFHTLHPEMLSKGGILKSTYARALDVISRIEKDDLFRLMIGGETQKIMTGEIGGVAFKAKIDSLLTRAQVKTIMDRHPETMPQLMFADGAICDLKVMKDFAPIWTAKHGKAHFITAWGYDIQGAVYRAIDGGRKPFFIAAATKQDPPDIQIFQVAGEVMDEHMLLIEPLAARYDGIKKGKIKPTACGQCAYCRGRKTLTSITDYRYDLNSDD